MPITVNWIKCDGGSWCTLLNVNLNHDHFDGMEGVYIVWHGGDNPATVRVGQGVIRDRIREHRDDDEVLQYSHLTLYVTWASVSAGNRDGVERYLAENLNPKVGHRFPQVRPIRVNFPW